MRIALVGYGKMGRELERLAPSMGSEIVARFDIDTPLREASSAEFDVAIEFSTPAAVMENITWLAEHKKPMVIGTTGWYDRLPEVKQIIESAGTGLFYASNYSIGVYLFNRLIAEASRLFQKFPEYDIAVHETHHRAKLDAPSGTALTLAATILQEWKSKTNMVAQSPRSGVAPDDLLVSSTRVGSVVGEHSVRIDGPADSVTLTHTAHSRATFATGALRAAEWVVGKKGVFSMDDMMK